LPSDVTNSAAAHEEKLTVTKTGSAGEQDKPISSLGKGAETGKKDVDELTEQELDKISGGPMNPPNSLSYIGETEKN
jgi:bacteriocin-like protein